MGGPALFPVTKVTMEQSVLGKKNADTIGLMQAASGRERDAYWKGQATEKKYDAQMTEWKRSFVSSVHESFGTPERMAGSKDFFASLGMDLSHFDDASAQAFYDRFFNNPKTDSDIGLFVAATMKSVQKTDGSYDEAKLASYLPTIKWVANTFGGNSAELAAQLIDAEMNRVTHPDTFVDQSNACVNALSNRETELLTFLTDGKTAPTVEPAADPENVRNREALDANVEKLTAYLFRLDQEAMQLAIDPVTGTITRNGTPLPPPTDPEQIAYEQRFTELKQKYGTRTADSIARLKATPGVLDVAEAMGAIVVTFDSSKSTPTPPGDLGIAFLTSPNDRAGYSKSSEHFLGLVEVDINKGKRTDNVLPTVSVTHELQHHALAMTDYLLTTDPTLPMASGYRKGRNESLFGDQHIVTSDDLFVRDLPHYQAAMDRPLGPADVRDIRLQLAYLDELHSSFLQKKPNWFNARNNVYAENNRDKKHWELVGGNPADIEASKRLFEYSQGLYAMASLGAQWRQKGGLTPEQTAFVSQFDAVYHIAGAYIGAGRSVLQVERFVAGLWDSLKKQFPETFTNPVTTEHFRKVEKAGASLPGTTDFLFG